MFISNNFYIIWEVAVVKKVILTIINNFREQALMSLMILLLN
jgi:hypothetical protein